MFMNLSICIFSSSRSQIHRRLSNLSLYLCAYPASPLHNFLCKFGSLPCTFYNKMHWLGVYLLSMCLAYTFPSTITHDRDTCVLIWLNGSDYLIGQSDVRLWIGLVGLRAMGLKLQVSLLVFFSFLVDVLLTKFCSILDLKLHLSLDFPITQNRSLVFPHTKIRKKDDFFGFSNEHN